MQAKRPTERVDNCDGLHVIVIAYCKAHYLCFAHLRVLNLDF